MKGQGVAAVCLHVWHNTPTAATALTFHVYTILQDRCLKLGHSITIENDQRTWITAKSV